MNITKEEGELAYKILKEQYKKGGLKCDTNPQSLVDGAQKLGVEPDKLYNLERKMAAELFEEHYPPTFDKKLSKKA